MLEILRKMRDKHLDFERVMEREEEVRSEEYQGRKKSNRLFGASALAIAAIAGGIGLWQLSKPTSNTQGQQQTQSISSRGSYGHIGTIDYPDEDVTGFHGSLRSANADRFPVYFQELFMVHDSWDASSANHGDYVGQLGASLYLIDGDSGQLLTPGSHEIRRDGDAMYVRTGARESLSRTPVTLQDVSAMNSSPGWVRREFEERDGGVYAKDWAQFIGDRGSN